MEYDADHLWTNHIMPANLQITPEAAQFIRNKGGQAIIDLICWKG